MRINAQTRLAAAAELTAAQLPPEFKLLKQQDKRYLSKVFASNGINLNTVKFIPCSKEEAKKVLRSSGQYSYILCFRKDWSNVMHLALLNNTITSAGRASFELTRITDRGDKDSLKTIFESAQVFYLVKGNLETRDQLSRQSRIRYDNRLNEDGNTRYSEDDWFFGNKIDKSGYLKRNLLEDPKLFEKRANVAQEKVVIIYESVYDAAISCLYNAKNQKEEPFDALKQLHSNIYSYLGTIKIPYLAIENKYIFDNYYNTNSFDVNFVNKLYKLSSNDLVKITEKIKSFAKK